MIKTLSLILFILLLIVGKKDGLKTYFCFYLNYFFILMYIFLLGMGINAIVLSLIECILAAIISLFFINGVNTKTISSFISICVVIVFLFLAILFIGKNANIQGFSSESIEAIGWMSYNINYNMTDLIIGIVLVCTIGTVVDTSISISTSLNEVYSNNENLNQNELYKSGMNVGKDILSTTINTLFFVFLGGIVGFFFWHMGETVEYIINYKQLVQELVELLFCCIGSIIVIPITSYVTSKLLLRKNL